MYNNENTAWKPATNNPDHLWKYFMGRMVTVTKNKYTSKWSLCVDGKWFNNIGLTRQEAVALFDGEPSRWMAEVAEMPQETEPAPATSLPSETRAVSPLETLLTVFSDQNVAEVRKALTQALDALRKK